MSIVPIFAAADQNYAWIGLLPAGVVAVALICNVSSFQTRDMNRKAGHATTLLFLAMLIESATWTVRAFGGGTVTGAFWSVITSAAIHVCSAAFALRAIWEFRTIGKWPYGRRRAAWGFWLNIIALVILAVWFLLCARPEYYKRYLG